MRGVVTLVAALALPQNFPERDRLIFIAFVVISVTLLLQGLTLPWLVRRLGVSASEDERHEVEQKLIRRARQAGFERLDELHDRGDVEDDVIEQARENADRMWHSIGWSPDGSDDGMSDRAGDAITVNAVKDELLAAAREAVVESRTESGTDPTIADRVLRRLDARGSQPE
jgi:CPA1 family monovalent cation:H+ antiporter